MNPIVSLSVGSLPKKWSTFIKVPGAKYSMMIFEAILEWATDPEHKFAIPYDLPRAAYTELAEMVNGGPTEINLTSVMERTAVIEVVIVTDTDNPDTVICTVSAYKNEERTDCWISTWFKFLPNDQVQIGGSIDHF